MKRANNAESRTVLPQVETLSGVPLQPQAKPLPRIPSLDSRQRQVPVTIVWQMPAAQEPQPETSVPPAAGGTSAASLVEKGVTLRAMIKSRNAAAIAELLAHPDAADIAMTVNPSGFNALGYAISNNDTDTARLLLQLSSGGEQALQGAGAFDAPLMAAALSGRNEIVDLLLRIDSAPTQVRKLLAASVSPLVFAADAGHAPVVQRLLDSEFGAELATSADKNGVNALVAAAYKGHVDVVKVMLASPHCPSLARGTDRAGSDALLRAAQRGHADIVRLLLASPHGNEMAGRFSVDGYDALYVAAREGYVDVVQALLQAPGYLEQRSAAGASRDPLAVALKNKHTEIAGLLRSHGFGSTAADPQAEPGSGSSE